MIIDTTRHIGETLPKHRRRVANTIASILNRDSQILDEVMVNTNRIVELKANYEERIADLERGNAEMVQEIYNLED